MTITEIYHGDTAANSPRSDRRGGNLSGGGSTTPPPRFLFLRVARINGADRIGRHATADTGDHYFYFPVSQRLRDRTCEGERSAATTALATSPLALGMICAPDHGSDDAPVIAFRRSPHLEG